MGDKTVALGELLIRPLSDRGTKLMDDAMDHVLSPDVSVPHAELVYNMEKLLLAGIQTTPERCPTAIPFCGESSVQ